MSQITQKEVRTSIHNILSYLIDVYNGKTAKPEDTALIFQMETQITDLYPLFSIETKNADINQLETGKISCQKCGNEIEIIPAKLSFPQDKIEDGSPTTTEIVPAFVNKTNDALDKADVLDAHDEKKDENEVVRSSISLDLSNTINHDFVTGEPLFTDIAPTFTSKKELKSGEIIVEEGIVGQNKAEDEPSPMIQKETESIEVKVEVPYNNVYELIKKNYIRSLQEIQKKLLSDPNYIPPIIKEVLVVDYEKTEPWTEVNCIYGNTLEDDNCDFNINGICNRTSIELRRFAVGMGIVMGDWILACKTKKVTLGDKKGLMYCPSCGYVPESECKVLDGFGYNHVCGGTEPTITHSQSCYVSKEQYEEILLTAQRVIDRRQNRGKENVNRE